jgi:hypothetical protein
MFVGPRALSFVTVLLSAAISVAAPPTDGLAGYWAFDEGKGTATADGSGNGNNGAIVGAAWTEGVSGSSLSFKGNGYVECPTSRSLDITDSITIAVWVYLNEYPDPRVSWGWRDIVNKAGAYQLSLVAAWGLTFGGLNDGKVSRRVPPDSDFTLNRWHHVAVTYRMAHNAQHLYIDGVERPVGNPGRVFAIDTTSNVLRIGNQDGGKKYGNSNHWVGRLDELRIYRRALGPTEVAEIYRAGAGGKK